MKLRKKLEEMFREVPRHSEPTTDKEILRQSIMAELDATNLYEFLAPKAKDRRIRTVLLDIAREEKTHIHEFEELLEMIDKEYDEEEENAEEELKKMKIRMTEATDMQKLHSEIKQFFIDNPNPSDKEVHAKAQEMGVDEHEFERHIYMILSSMLKR